MPSGMLMVTESALTVFDVLDVASLFAGALDCAPSPGAQHKRMSAMLNRVPRIKQFSPLAVNAALLNAGIARTRSTRALKSDSAGLSRIQETASAAIAG